MDDAPQRIPLLEMEEPPFSFGGIHNRALMGAVDGCRAGFQHDLALIRPIDILGTEDGLPAATDTTFRDAHVIIAVPLVDLGPFRDMPPIHGHAIVQQFPAVRGHLVDDDGTGPIEAVSQIGLAVLIPERAGVFPVIDGFHAMERGPWTCRIGCGTHEQSLVRRTEIDIEEPVVKADAGRPRTAGIVPHLVPAGQVEAGIDLGDELPVRQVGGFQHLHAQEMEIRSNHVIAVSETDGIGIGIIGQQNRIPVIAVLRISPGSMLGPAPRTEGQQDTEQETSLFLHYLKYSLWAGTGTYRSDPGDFQDQDSSWPPSSSKYTSL